MENDTVPTGQASMQDHGSAQGKKPKKMDKKIIIGIAVIIIIVALFFVYKKVFVAATVNGQAISRLSVIHTLEKSSGKNVLESLITEAVIKQEAKKRDITVSNEEIDQELAGIEAQVAGQGSTLEDALALQGITLDNLKNQIIIKKLVEKMIADQLQVSDDEINAFISGNGVEIPEGQEFAYRAEIVSQIESQKFSANAQPFVDGLMGAAKIKYNINY